MNKTITASVPCGGREYFTTVPSLPHPPSDIHTFDTVSRQFVWVGETKYLAEGATRRADRNVVLEGYLQVANSGGFIE